MTIEKTQNGSVLCLALQGRLDTTTAPQLETEISGSIAGVTDLRLDFANLEYISSAGLRVLLATQKIMNQQGSMVISNANSDILEVFDITGFSDILTIR